MIKHVEESDQVSFAGWFRVQYPKFKKLITVPSFGENIGPRRMMRLKQMGLTPGWPDIFIAVPQGDMFYSGLFIEMKVVGQKLKPHQKEIHEALIAVGYAVKTCWSWTEAKEITKAYMNGIAPLTQSP